MFGTREIRSERKKKDESMLINFCFQNNLPESFSIRVYDLQIHQFVSLWIIIFVSVKSKLIRVRATLRPFVYVRNFEIARSVSIQLRRDSVPPSNIHITIATNEHSLNQQSFNQH